MDVACSTLCFANEPFETALRHIAEMEFPKIDLAIAAGSSHLTPEDVVADSASVLQRIRKGPMLGIAGVTAWLKSTGDEYEAQLEAAAHLAKQLSAPVVVILAAPTSTPVEEEIQRLSKLERMVSLHGVVLTVATKMDTLTEDPATTLKLCEAVPGLGVTLDPSHYISGPAQGKSYDALFPFVRHLHLRDSGRRRDQLQVKVGRGEIEYGKVITALDRFQYKGSLVVDVEPALATEDMDVEAEVRKLRLLLESLI
jgi:sugar phosphate isomerase/epimerase